jgi:hypothetical protein
MAYVKPQVLVFQEFTIVPTEITEPLRAHISGPHAVLHRYNNSDEKALMRVGVYNPAVDTAYAWPQRLAGSRIDADYVKLYADDALLRYYEDTISDLATTTRPVKQKSNWIESVAGSGPNATAIHYRVNGGFNRSGVFKDRDVKVGDIVYLRSVADDVNCTETTLWTSVAGFASTTIPSEIENATADINNAESTTAGSSSVKLAGAVNRVRIASVNAADYSGVEDGAITEVYTVEVVTSSISGCNSARLRVRSASKRDDVAEVTPAAFGSETVIGTRGLKVTFANAVLGAPNSNTFTAGVAVDTFVIGQKWQITVSQTFAEVIAISNNENSVVAGSYTGDKNDTYIIECTKGGYVEEGGTNFPHIVVRTAKGLDFSGPFEVVNSGVLAGDFFPIGSHGVAVAFATVSPSSSSSSSSSAGSSGTSFVPVASMRKGDKWYIKVVSSKAGPVNQLILRDDLPTAMRAVVTMNGSTEVVTYPALDIRLFIKSDIEITENRVGFAPLVNYTKEDTQIVVKAGAIAYHPEWTLAGVEQPLPVTAGTLYVQYREWLSELCDEVNSIASVADLDQIRGQLDPDNPLKWGVYKALSNTLGTVVKYTAVCEPDDLDSWVQVLERIKGRDDLYNLVPLTFDTRVHNLFAAHIGGESNEIQNNWKAGFFGIQSRNRKMLVGEGAPIAGVAGNEIAEPVLATISDDTAATGDQYTLLQVPNGVGYFITNDVQPGDLVRYSYTVDGFGATKYSEYVVDEVLSESSLRLYSGTDTAITTPQRVEIWHNMNRNEMADDIAERAGAMSNRRVCAVWPDQVGSAGTLQPGYFLAAALAGLASSVVPHQGLTNVEVAGFDDYTRSYKMFNETQLNRMAAAGVWIVTEDRDGTPYNRHALTTDNLDLNRREEMIRRNVDSISYLFLRRLRPYIGRTNATPLMVTYLSSRVSEVIDFLKNNGYTQELGSQLIDGSIRVLRIHPLLKDRIEIVLDLVVPAPLNNIELHLVV